MQDINSCWWCAAHCIFWGALKYALYFTKCSNIVSAAITTDYKKIYIFGKFTCGLWTLACWLSRQPSTYWLTLCTSVFSFKKSFQIKFNIKQFCFVLFFLPLEKHKWCSTLMIWVRLQAEIIPGEIVVVIIVATLHIYVHNADLQEHFHSCPITSCPQGHLQWCYKGYKNDFCYISK